MTLLCILPQEIHCDSTRCTLHTKNLADLVHPYLKTNYNSGNRTRKVSIKYTAYHVRILLSKIFLSRKVIAFISHDFKKYKSKVKKAQNIL